MRLSFFFSPLCKRGRRSSRTVLVETNHQPGPGVATSNCTHRALLFCSSSIMLSGALTWLQTKLERLQAILSFEGWNDYPLFSTKQVRKPATTGLKTKNSPFQTNEPTFFFFIPAGSWTGRINRNWFGMLLGSPCLWFCRTLCMAKHHGRQHQQRPSPSIHGMAVVRLCIRRVGVSSFRILYDSFVQSIGCFV